MKARRIVVELDAETWAALALVADRARPGDAKTPAELLALLADTLACGVGRAGSWERGWVTQATGWDGDGTREDPAHSWREVPMRVRHPRRARAGVRRYARAGYPRQGVEPDNRAGIPLGRAVWAWTQ